MKKIEAVSSRKCWRERVTAEITVAHLVEFAREAGDEMSLQEAANFLNENGNAYEMWMHMMHAGEAFLKSRIHPRIPVQGVRENETVRMVN